MTPAVSGLMETTGTIPSRAKPSGAVSRCLRQANGTPSSARFTAPSSWEPHSSSPNCVWMVERALGATTPLIHSSVLSSNCDENTPQIDCHKI
ncbi:hypothetical protein ATANTOWER_015985 [Ataeniobius toweri]|uniref:Uncharacterized protein n=1 Tax=Ataeniobius toweri TaxID=208326 RepID=A0ABU7B9K1_9TELE|nr:hypothetical protein [Ataeniobius toweri]